MSKFMEKCVFTKRIRFGDGLYTLRKDPSVQHIEVDVTYFDNAHHVPSDAQVVTMNHGYPGKWTLFSKVIEQFHNDGYRVIAPTLPSMNLMKRYRGFKNSPEEKVSMMEALFKQIDPVDRITLGLGHSFGAFIPLLMKYTPGLPEVGAVCMGNIIDYINPKATERKVLVRELSQLMLETDSLHDEITHFIMKLYQEDHNPHGLSGSADDCAEPGIAIFTSNFQEIECSIRKIMEDATTHFIAVYSVDDSCFHLNDTEIMLRQNNMNPESSFVFDEQQHLIQQGSTENNNFLIRCMKGGHFSFLKQIEFIRSIVNGKFNN